MDIFASAIRACEMRLERQRSSVQQTERELDGLREAAVRQGQLGKPFDAKHPTERVK